MTSKYQAINQRLTRLEKGQTAQRMKDVAKYMDEMKPIARFVLMLITKRK